MNELKKLDKINVENMIYEIRGKQVMVASEITETNFYRKDASYE